MKKAIWTIVLISMSLSLCFAQGAREDADIEAALYELTPYEKIETRLVGAESLKAEPHTVAKLNAFIENDPLYSDNGMVTSPAAPLIYGPINIGFDDEGNGILAVDQQDFLYVDGYYYLIGQSFEEGAMHYAPGVSQLETLPTDIPTLYRWSGMRTYKSADLENWTLVNSFYPREPETGRHIVVTKPRVAYSEATGNYVMWFNNKAPKKGEAAILVMTAPSIEGPWSLPTAPTVPEGVTYKDLTHDYQIKVDPETGIGWFTQAMTNTKLYRMTKELTGVEEDISFEMSGSGNFGTNAIAGGMGFFEHNGWWYITGTKQCGNCVGTAMSYVMARSPEGPWLSPDTLSADQPLVPALISADGLLSQSHGASVFPALSGGTVPLLYGTHYRSSATGAPLSELTGGNAGENNLALSGQFWYTLDFEEDGRIKTLEPRPAYEIELAKEVTSAHVKAYQADFSITAKRSACQEFIVSAGDEVSCILPSIFQMTPDESPATNKFKAQDALVNAPLLAQLQLPDGTVYNWTIDARTVGWNPRQIALNLPVPYTEGGKLVLTLSTKATNGGYGVALGEGSADTVYKHIDAVGKDKKVTEYPGQLIYLRTSSEKASAPVITLQPESVTVKEGTIVGFLVQAEGIGVGYQWYKDGSIVMPHGVTEGTRNESACAALRLASVTMEDAGVYYAEAMNAVGKTTSRKVTLTVIPSDK